MQLGGIAGLTVLTMGIGHEGAKGVPRSMEPVAQPAGNGVPTLNGKSSPVDVELKWRAPPATGSGHKNH